MCNIAGYVGEQRAAPLLIEMLRRQQGFDGGACTGIVTIFEGRLYYRRVVGDVDTLVRTTDALYLPGNIGIAHSRPGGSSDTYGFSHPFITYDERMAAVTNGTARGGNPGKIQAFTEELEKRGYQFRGEAFVAESGMPRLKNGAYVSSAEVRLNGIREYQKSFGLSLTAAMAKYDSDFYKDGVIALLSADEPDRISVLRTSRPAVTMRVSHGTLLATTRFAFPEDEEGTVEALPVMYPCQILADKTVVTEDKMTGCEEVSEPTEYTFTEGYKRISALLEGKRDAPLHFDDLEFAVWREMRDLFEGNHTLIQDARLVYDVLWRLHEEGRLRQKSILISGGKRLSPDDPMYADARNLPGAKNRTFMWIEDQ